MDAVDEHLLLFGLGRISGSIFKVTNCYFMKEDFFCILEKCFFATIKVYFFLNKIGHLHQDSVLKVMKIFGKKIKRIVNSVMQNSGV